MNPQSFFSNLNPFGRRPVEGEKRQVQVTAYSQPHVLQQRMKEQKLTHGETVTANLSPVRIERLHNGKTVMYFCPLQSIEVLSTETPGDGGAIPSQVILDNVSVDAGLLPDYRPTDLFTLKNVKLFSNGTMQVIATEKTSFVPYNHTESPYAHLDQRFAQEAARMNRDEMESFIARRRRVLGGLDIFGR